MAHTNKNMVIISLQETNTGFQYLFEEEHHYMYEHRVILYQYALSSLDKKSLLKDKEFCIKSGIDLANTLLVNKKFADKRSQKYQCLVIYQYEKSGEQFIRFDKETYKKKSHRQTLTAVPAKSIDQLTAIRDIPFVEKLGKNLVEYLSFNPDEKSEGYKRLITKERPYMYEKR